MNHTLQPICFEDLSLIFMVGLKSCTDSVGIVIVLHTCLVHVPKFELLLQCQLLGPHGWLMLARERWSHLILGQLLRGPFASFGAFSISELHL